MLEENVVRNHSASSVSCGSLRREREREREGVWCVCEWGMIKRNRIRVFWRLQYLSLQLWKTPIHFSWCIKIVYGLVIVAHRTRNLTHVRWRTRDVKKRNCYETLFVHRGIHLNMCTDVRNTHSFRSRGRKENAWGSTPRRGLPRSSSSARFVDFCSIPDGMYFILLPDTDSSCRDVSSIRAVGRLVRALSSNSL